ncbi:MAG: hypothetical protein ABL999_17055 [Pyrinomonadaceae bacterium]
MTARIFVFSSLFLVSLLSFGCGGAANNTPANNALANTANANKPAKDEVTNAAPTVSPVFKAYCEAWAKKDEAGIRKAYSADTLKYFEDGMKEEKIKSLMKYLEDDAITGNICEARNEVITGDKAVAEIRADKFPNGIKIEFVKENGEWKMTNKSPEVDAVKATGKDPVAPANAANRPAADPAGKKDN